MHGALQIQRVAARAGRCDQGAGEKEDRGVGAAAGTTTGPDEAAETSREAATVRLAEEKPAARHAAQLGAKRINHYRREPSSAQGDADSLF